jgi:hypothetical protein
VNRHSYKISTPALSITYFSIVKGLLIIPLMLLCALAEAQQLNGIWKGTLTQQPGGCFPVYNVELQVSIDKGSVTGFCYHYSDVLNYVKKNYTGIFNAGTNTINIQEQRVTTFHIPSECTPCIRYFTLTYRKEGAKETLTGDWGGVVMNSTAACTPGKIVLNRILESEFNHIQEIRVDSGLLKLEFYDNAEIDGDSVTVMLDSKALITNQKLGIRPLTLEIKVGPQQKEQEITMIADNLGTIPPNTAMLIVTAGTKKYRLFLKSDKQKSAQVRVIYDPQQME